MNLHEECLLKYLSNPMGLSATTELLKLNNAVLEKGAAIVKTLAKGAKINYTNRV